MEFLKEILGDELFNQLSTAINAHNGNEANKDKQIKLGNLATGEYVGKGKYDALQTLLDGKDAELTTANGLIADLKKATKGNEEIQGKVTAYETQVADLQKQLDETKVKSAIKVALLSDKALDVDYLTFKLNEKLNAEGKSLELDENDNIKDWKTYSDGLKVQFPTQFESSSNKNINVNRLPDHDDHKGAEPKSLAEALQQQFEHNNE